MTVIAATDEGLAACASSLQRGGLVAMPTETVYGLAADATNAAAITAIYEAKRRPQFNPLICHVADVTNADELGRFNEAATRLATAFWPGPLTLVVPRRADCPIDLLASAGLDTLAVRVPAHETAQALLRRVGRPLVAPSANPSGRLSPSTAAHVAALMPDIDVLDGGACRIGLESTIIGCFHEAPVLLRSGGLARQDIEACLGRTVAMLPDGDDTEAKRAPGRLARHYAPQSGLRLNADRAGADEWLIGFGPDAPDDCLANLSPAANLAEAAAALFAVLHETDARAVTAGKTLAVMPVPETGLGEAINDRLRRAAAG